MTLCVEATLAKPPVIESWERCFHVDGNGLRESNKGVTVGHEAKCLQSLFHSSAAAGVGTTVKKKQPMNETKKHDHFFRNIRNRKQHIRNRKQQKLKPRCNVL